MGGEKGGDFNCKLEDPVLLALGIGAAEDSAEVAICGDDVFLALFRTTPKYGIVLGGYRR